MNDDLRDANLVIYRSDWLSAMIFDPECGEPGVFVNGKNRLVLGGPGSILTGIRSIHNNTFAPVPICGYAYASAQYMGSGSSEVQFQIVGLGDDEISHLQAAYEEVEKNARFFRKVKGAGSFLFEDNEFLKLAQISRGLASSISTETLGASTDLKTCRISFTSEGHFTERFQQEYVTNLSGRYEILEALLQLIVPHIPPEARGHLAPSGSRNSRGTYSNWVPGPEPNPQGSSTGEANGVFGRILEQVLQRGSDIIGVPEDIANDSVLPQDPNQTPEQREEARQRRAQENSASRYEVAGNNLAGRYIRFLKSVDEDDFRNEVLDDLITILTDSRETTPPSEFVVGESRGSYIDRSEIRGSFFNQEEIVPVSVGGIIHIPGVRRTVQHPTIENTPLHTLEVWPTLFDSPNRVACRLVWGYKKTYAGVRRSEYRGSEVPDTTSIYGSLRGLEDSLLAKVAEFIGSHQGTSDFQRIYGENAGEGRELSVHPAYPDLELPPHPATGRVIDTNPDYYFYNESEEGRLSDMGPQMLLELDQRVTNSEAAFLQLSSGQLWERTNLGPNRTQMDGMNINLPSPGDALPSPHGLPTIDSVSPTDGNILGGGGNTNAESLISRNTRLSSIAKSTNTEETGADAIRAARNEMLQRTVYGIPNLSDASLPLRTGPIDQAFGETDRTHGFTRAHVLDIAVRALEQFPDETYTMRRAFPTFKIYFIEDDIGFTRQHFLPDGETGGTGINILAYMDDLYSYNSIKSIRLVRDRENPADLLILELTNVTGLMDRRKWDPDLEFQREPYMPGFAETEMENPLKKLVLKEGLKIQARFGYTNNANQMLKKFNGELVEISFNADCPDEMTIICQSFGAELMIEPKGINTKGEEVRYIDTPDILHTLLCAPELAHFGRYNLNPQFNPSEARTRASDLHGGNGGGLVTTSSVQDVLDGAREVLAKSQTKWLLGNNPADDNIFAPSLRDYEEGWNTWLDDRGRDLQAVSAISRSIGNWALGHVWRLAGGFNLVLGLYARYLVAAPAGWLAGIMSGTGYSPCGQTIWEIVKECTLRHPSWIGAIRTYGTRSTLFFGVPDHDYWADEITTQEIRFLNQYREAIGPAEGAGPLGSWEGVDRMSPFEFIQALTRQYGCGIAGTLAVVPTLGDTGLLAGGSLVGNSMFSDFLPYFRILRSRAQIMGDRGHRLALSLGRFRPFRRYHLITSSHHIISNNIRASLKGVPNTIMLQYGSGGDQYKTIKADDNIPDELVRLKSYQYPSCETEDLARRYCMGLLKEGLQRVYKGEILVTGMDIDPYDICHIHDERSQIYGPFQVRAVVDTITPETGWITEITPDMIVGTNEWSTQTTTSATGAVMAVLYDRYRSQINTTMGIGLGAGAVEATALGTGALGTTVAVPAIGTLLAGSMLAYYGGYELIRWTQERQPIWAIPLILDTRPLLTGLDGFRQDGIFASLRGALFAEVDAVSEGWRRLHLGAYGSDIAIRTGMIVTGQAGQ